MRKAFVIACTLFVCIGGIAQEDTTKTSKTTFRFGGYVKADFLSTWYHNGDVNAKSPMKDIHFPGQIPVGTTNQNFNTDYHVKESRFNFDVKTELLGKDVSGFLELDFLLSSQGNARVSNSFSPRLRHFYFQWGDWLIGQTWSTFMIVVVPDDLDFAGAAEGLIFNRQPQIRYTHNNWQFSIENPETTVMDFQANEIRETEKELIPDLVIRRNFPLKKGFLSVSMLNRALSGKTDVTGEVKSTYAFGLSTGGKLMVGDKGSDFRFMASYGTGLGRYAGLAFTAGGVLDQSQTIHGIESANGFIAYNHYWIPKRWSSSFNVSAFEAFNDMALVSPNANDKAYSVSGNLKFTPAPELLFGIEFMHGYRELANNVTYGSFNRIQFSAKYSFGYQNSIANEKR